MAIKLLLAGFDVLRDALAQLPEDLANDARAEVVRAANDTASELRSVYPIGKPRKHYPGGALRAGVKVKVTTGPVSTRAVVTSTAPHAHLWEFGTVDRRWDKGKEVGRMKAQYNVGLIGIAKRHRARLDAAQLAIVRAAGFKVSGAA